MSAKSEIFLYDKNIFFICKRMDRNTNNSIIKLKT